MTSEPKQLFAVPLPMDTFGKVLHERESLANAGSTFNLDAPTGLKVWDIAGEWVGRSTAADSLESVQSWALVALSSDQHLLVLRARMEGVAGEALADYLWHMARIPRFDSYPLTQATPAGLDAMLALENLIQGPRPYLPVGTHVRMNPRTLAKEPQAYQKRLADRIGVVTGYRMGAREPIVSFPAMGRRKELRLFEVSRKQLQVVAPSRAEAAE